MAHKRCMHTKAKRNIPDNFLYFQNDRKNKHKKSKRNSGGIIVLYQNHLRNVISLTDNGGGVLIFIREDIPCKLLNKHSSPEGIEGLFIEVNFRKSKWLLFGTYHPPSQKDDFYFDSIGSALDDAYSGLYDKILLTGDFNAEIDETILTDILELYDLDNLVKEKTCFKSLLNPRLVSHKLPQLFSAYKSDFNWFV